MKRIPRGEKMFPLFAVFSVRKEVISWSLRALHPKGEAIRFWGGVWCRRESIAP